MTNSAPTILATVGPTETAPFVLEIAQYEGDKPQTPGEIGAARMIARLIQHYSVARIRHRKDIATLDQIALFSSSAAEFIVDFAANPFETEPPPEYPTDRLKTICAWLRKQTTPEKILTARKAALKRLSELQSDYQFLAPLSTIPESRWEVDGPNRRWSLPLFPQTKEGVVAEMWWCYSGAIVFLNLKAKLNLVDLGDHG